jgi:hypothetical protein
MEISKQHQQCKKCGEVKHKRDFYKNSKMANGYDSSCKACKKAGYNSTVAKEKYILRKYQLTMETFRKLMNDGCEICGDTEKLVLDHNHDTGAFRGCLCHRCNTAIGQFKDSIEVMENAINYIKEKGSYDRSNF